MYSHMMVGSDDLDKAKAFYDATFQALGGKPGITDPKGRLIYLYNGGVFMVTNSSAAVGWTAMVASNWALVAPI